jgi:hypothetical protein
MKKDYCKHQRTSKIQQKKKKTAKTKGKKAIET